MLHNELTEKIIGAHEIQSVGLVLNFAKDKVEVKRKAKKT